MKYHLLLFLFFLPFIVLTQTLTNSTNITITKTWSQEPSGWTYPMNISVPTDPVPQGGFPVCILLHGNGGNGGGTLLQFGNILDCHALVAPTGYENSWNICGENSDAPDVEMVTDLINQLQTYTNINPNKIRILGSSNGAALANSVFIQNTDTGVDIVCAIVSQLSEVQYHDNGFYYPSGETDGAEPDCGYDIPITPITGRKYLSICNENDGVIPYFGGSSPVGVSFLDAQLATYIIAQHEGYVGAQLPEAGTQIGSSTVYEYAYLSGQVVHLKGDAGHGTNETQRDYISTFFENCGATEPVLGCTDPAATNYNPAATEDDGSCTYSNEALANSTDINITKTWYQEPSGWTYPIEISVPTDPVPTGGFPVAILLHGNGGNGLDMLNEWSTELDCHVLVAPSGYMNSWNIADEASDAPDVEMMNDLISQLQTYNNVNANKIRVLGASNGAALANRVLIENSNQGVDIICAIVSQLFRGQFHNGNFYYPSGTTGGTDFFDGYDTEITPIMGRRYLSICNTNDPIIPYDGGPAVGVNFWAAQTATHIVAESQGFVGPPMTGDGTQLGSTTVYEYSYLSDQVVHLRGDAEHSINTTQLEYINDFFAESCAVLPVEMADFKVTEKNCIAHLQWQTLLEKDNLYFEIEKSVDGNSFEVIEQVEGMNNNLGSQSYNFIDKDLNQVNYYRIVAIGKDGNRSESGIISLESDCFFERNPILIYPNPAIEWIRIERNHLEVFQYTLTSTLGKIIRNGVVKNNEKIDLSALSANVYFLKIENEVFRILKL